MNSDPFWGPFWSPTSLICVHLRNLRLASEGGKRPAIVGSRNCGTRQGSGFGSKPKGLRKTLETVADKITVANRQRNQHFVLDTYQVEAFNLPIY